MYATDRFQDLKDKISLLPDGQARGVSRETQLKGKVKALTKMSASLTQAFEDDLVDQEARMNALIDTLHKYEIVTKEQTQTHQLQIHHADSQLNKTQKALLKVSQRLANERKQLDKKIKSTMEGYLIELNGLKSRYETVCDTAIKQVENLSKDVDVFDKDFKLEQASSRETQRKIYSGFLKQIQQINDILEEDEAQRRQDESAVLDRLEKEYSRLSQAIQSNATTFDVNSSNIVELLEKVIEKIQNELQG